MRNIIKDIYRNTKGFLIPYLFFALSAIVFLIIFEKGKEVLLINSFSNSMADRFFLIITDVGLGGFAVIIALLMLVYSFKWSFLTLLSLAGTGILTFTFKRILFLSETRPLHYFYYADFTRFIHDAPLIYYNSFPSGHTMTIFAFCFILSWLSGNVRAGIVLFFLALTVGLSRIYLLQHFGIDVLAGSVLGILAAAISILIYSYIIPAKLKNLLDNGLWNLFANRTN
jgi:membrane-associated phospholipid phosphatase